MPDRPNELASEGAEREWAEERAADERSERTNRKNLRLASPDYLCSGGRKRRIDWGGPFGSESFTFNSPHFLSFAK